MKIKGLDIKSGHLCIDGAPRQCPYGCSSPEDGPTYCGTWCALCVVERPFEGQVKIHMNCGTNITYEG